MKTTRWSGFFSSESASKPRRCRSLRRAIDFGVGTAGRNSVKPARINHVTAPLYPASTEVSAFSALTNQQPDIQPNVAVARIGPNSFCESFSVAKTIVEERLHVGAKQSAYSWIKASMNQGLHLRWIAVLTAASAKAE